MARNSEHEFELDVHAYPIKACAFEPTTGEIERKPPRREPGELASWIKPRPNPQNTPTSRASQTSTCAAQQAPGVVTKVHVPDPRLRGARSLTRALADAHNDDAHTKQRLSKLLFGHGLQ